jgi:hypothetical protein
MCIMCNLLLLVCDERYLWNKYEFTKPRALNPKTYSFGKYFSHTGSIVGMTPKADENINLGA